MTELDKIPGDFRNKRCGEIKQEGVAAPGGGGDHLEQCPGEPNRKGDTRGAPRKGGRLAVSGGGFQAGRVGGMRGGGGS